MIDRKPPSIIAIGVAYLGAGLMAMELVPGVWPILLIISGLGSIALHFAMRCKYDILWRNLKLGYQDQVFPLCKRITEKDNYTLYEFTIPAGLSLDDFLEKQDAIEVYAGCRVELSVGYKNLYLREYDKAERVQYDYDPHYIRGQMPIMIGYDRDGKLVSVNLADGEPHMVIAGETGSGKSTVLRSILVNLVLTTDVDLYLIDLKNGVEFNMYRKLKNIQGFARNPAEAYSLLKQVTEEVDRRYDLLFQANCEDIRQYNKSHNLRYQVLVVDEFASLMSDKDCLALVETLAAKARACGIHIILATQRPDAKVITGRIKANVTNVLGLKTIDKTNSRVIIDHEGLETLRGKGHGIFRRGGDEVTIQCPYLSSDKARELITPYYRPELPEHEAQIDLKSLEGFKNAHRPRSKRG